MASKKDVDQVLLSLYRGGDVFETIFTYNTPYSPSHWLNLNWNNSKAMVTESESESEGEGKESEGEKGEREEEKRKERVIFKHINLYDIPRGIVPDQVYEMAEGMRIDNEQEWKHTIMGEVGDPRTQVFSNLKPMRGSDVDWDAKENWALIQGWKVCIGVDYGYSPDPTAFTISLYNRNMKILWVIAEGGGTRLSEEGIYLEFVNMVKRCNDHQKELLMRTGIGDRYINERSMINSEIDNRIIDSLRSAGLNIYPVKKGPGSRDVSYQFLTGGYGDLKDLWVDPEECPNTWAEMVSAEFPRRDVGGREIIIQEFPSYQDHYIDSLRYRLV